MKKKMTGILAVLALTGILFAAKALAMSAGPEIQTGSISGVVMLYTLKPAAGVKIVVDLGGGGKLEAKTNDKGYYLLGAVSVGTGYKVTASKDGYQSKTTSKVKVDPKKNTSVNFFLFKANN